MANYAAANKDLKLTPQERALYRRHLDNLKAGGVQNEDGSTSTLFQMSFEQNGKVYNVPTVWKNADGKPEIVPPEEAIKRANAEGIDKFPSYPSTDAAEQRYSAMHGYMEKDVPATTSQSAHPGYEEGVTQGPDTVPDLQIAHDGTKYVSPKATIAPNQFAEAPPPMNPYAKYAADVAKLPPKERTAVQALLNQKQNAYNKQIVDYNNRKKAFDQQEARRVAAETKQAQTELAKSMSAYDQTFKGRTLEQATKDVKEAWDNATASAPYGGQTFDDPNSPDAKKALAENADAYKMSIFNDKQVAPGKLRDIAYSLMTSNPNMTAERAVRLVQQLTTIDPTDATKRVYQPVGRDVTASKNVVVKPAEGGPYQFGPVHIRQDAYNDLTKIVQGRLKRAAAAGKADAEAAATGAEGSTGSVGVISRIPGAAAATGKYVIGDAPRGGMIGDVLRVAPKSRLFTPNQNAQDVLDAARRARRYVDERLKDKPGAVDLMTIPQVQ